MPHGGFLQPQKVVAQFDLKSDMKVAHFGCGHGYFTIPMAKIAGPNGKIYAIDILDEALQAVKAQAKIYNLTNIELIKANLEMAGSSLLDNNSIDLVLLANVLFQSQKKNNMVKEAKRVIKTNGRIIIIDWAIDKAHFGVADPITGKESGQPASLRPPDKLTLVKRTGEALLAGWRLSEIDMRAQAESEGLVFEKELETGEYHYGMVFKK